MLPPKSQINLYSAHNLNSPLFYRIQWWKRTTYVLISLRICFRLIQAFDVVIYGKGACLLIQVMCCIVLRIKSIIILYYRIAKKHFLKWTLSVILDIYVISH